MVCILLHCGELPLSRFFVKLGTRGDTANALVCMKSVSSGIVEF